jgi:uncharacterized protein
MSTSCAPGAVPPVITALLRPETYPHPAENIEILETHISWVFLAGRYAYKVKKPVDLAFLDFTTLEKRRYFCEEELRLNRRLASQLYLDVVEIRGTPAQPRIGGSGPVLDYALRMRRFPQEALASRLLADGRLAPELVDALALRIARFHADLPPAPPDLPFGTTECALCDACQNFEQIAAMLQGSGCDDPLSGLGDWTEREFMLRYNDFRDRHLAGTTRECHGDLHLRNIVLIDGELVPFDCIEFNAGLRWIDVMNEVAFLFMDLMDRGASQLAWRFLNAYLEANGVYSGLSVLRYYVVYRALVRAKVHLMRSRQADVGLPESARLENAYRAYVGLAQRCTTLGRPGIVVMHGFSGSGKSTIALSLVEELGAIRIRSDLERKRLHGLAPLARSRSAVSSGLYGQDATQATYARLAEAARVVVASGYTAIVDATFLLRAQRAELCEVAANAGVPIVLIDVCTPERLLRARILSRMGQPRDPSEANLDVLQHQLATAEPVVEQEALPVVTVDGLKRLDATAVGNISRCLSRVRTHRPSTHSGALPIL